MITLPRSPPAVIATESSKQSCSVSRQFYRPFFLGALFVMLLAGAGWGTALLVKFASAGKYTDLSLHEINAHGHAMLSGFIQLFIIGFAYQAFPRLFGRPLAGQRWCAAVFALCVIGLTFSVAGQLGNAFPASAWVTLSGDSMEVLALIIFTVQMFVTYRSGGAPLEPHIMFIMAAILCMDLSAISSTWLNWQTLRAESRMEVVYYVSTFQPSLRYLQLHGSILLMILGVSHRLLTNFYAMPRTSNRGMIIALAMLICAVVAESTLFVLFRTTGQAVFAKWLLLPYIGLIAGCAGVALRWRLWRRPIDLQGRTDRMAPFVQSAFAWLAVALAMTIALPFWNRYLGVYFSHAFYGGSRQAFVFGFATMMIVAFSLRIVPNLNGIVPTRLPSMRLTLWLLNTGCAAQVILQVVGDVSPRAMVVLPVAGAAMLTGIVLWTHHLLWCMREGRRIASNEPASQPVKRLVVLGERAAKPTAAI